jgi:hypothetical protein
MTKNNVWLFRKFDTAQSKNVVESSERSHFVENWLLYHFKFLKHHFFASSRCWKTNFEGFLRNFLETKRKSTPRNPYKPKDNLIRSIILEIDETNFLMLHVYLFKLILSLRIEEIRVTSVTYSHFFVLLSSMHVISIQENSFLYAFKR